jgi:hypothetical protein
MLAALATLAALPCTARADTADISAEYRTLHVGTCPEDRAKAVEPRNTCAKAELLFVQIPKMPWLDRLLAQSAILPMFSEVLGKKRLPPLAPDEVVKTRYLELLKTLIRRERPAKIDFSASLMGCDENNRAQETNRPRPEFFGPLLQLCLTHTLSREGEAHPDGPSGGSIVIDTDKRKILTFGDLILPGREKALETLQRAAFRATLKTRDDMTEAAIEEHLATPPFAFHLGKNWRIAKDGLIFGYGMYEIGPRTFGRPEIFISRHELEGIVRPDILTHIP